MNHDYLQSAMQQFEYYKLLGEKTFAQMPEEKLSWQINPESNSMATIVKHLAGYMINGYCHCSAAPSNY